jgi:hypothetical protein
LSLRRFVRANSKDLYEETAREIAMASWLSSRLLLLYQVLVTWVDNRGCARLADEIVHVVFIIILENDDARNEVVASRTNDSFTMFATLGNVIIEGDDSSFFSQISVIPTSKNVQLEVHHVSLPVRGNNIIGEREVD